MKSQRVRSIPLLMIVFWMCASSVAYSQGVGNGPEFLLPSGIDVDSSGNVFLTDFGIPAVFHIDPVSGDRTIVSKEGVGLGANFPGNANRRLCGGRR